MLTVPSFDDLVSGKVTVSQSATSSSTTCSAATRWSSTTAGLRDWLAGRVVMVTGAGGSIGAELCRQIARFAPQRSCCSS